MTTSPQFVAHEKLNDDLFLVTVPNETDSVLLYAPLRRRAAKLSTAIAQEIRDNTTFAQQILDENHFSDTTWNFPSAPEDHYYSPTIPGSIMLSVTSRCNLRCAYCFADGGDYDDTMSWEVAQAFLDFVPAAARKNGNRYSVSFHGDGETLMAPAMTYRIIAALKDLAAKHNFKLNVTMTTNATLINESNIQLIKDNFDHLGVSFDGDDIAQGDNRPLANGQSSFPALFRAIQLLQQYGVSYGFRGTITSGSVSRMPEMVDFVLDVMKSKNLHLEPATACNRAGESMIPSAEDFVKYFRLAKARAKERGVHLFCSAARPDNLSQMFCGTSNAGMTLLADGTITACSRVTHPEDPYIDKYVFGKYNKKIGAFEFYPEKITNLRTNTIVTAYEECNDCFARWHCSGICPANRDRGSAPYLCEISQRLTMDGLMENFYGSRFTNQQERRQQQQQQVVPNEQAPMNAQDTAK